MVMELYAFQLETASAYPGVNRCQTGGKVPKSPIAKRMRDIVEILLKLTSLPFHMEFKTINAMKKAAMPNVDLPESGPTGLYQFRAAPKLSLTSENNTIKPKIPEPIPPASNAAAAGPFGLSTTFMDIVFLLISSDKI
jgi:hypothetical protein